MSSFTNYQNLTKDQKGWLIKLFNDFFPHVPFSECPIDLFNDDNLLSDNRALKLPKHLQYPEKQQTVLALDIPKMLDNQLIQNLIDTTYLSDLKTKSEAETFSIPEYLIRKRYEADILIEEKRFADSFSEFCPASGTYSENVPDLFFKKLASRIIPAKYDSKQKCFIWDFIFDFDLMFFHKNVRNVISAYQHFARLVYNYRVFGMEAGLGAKDNKSIQKEF